MALLAGQFRQWWIRRRKARLAALRQAQSAQAEQTQPTGGGDCPRPVRRIHAAEAGTLDWAGAILSKLYAGMEEALAGDQ